MPYINVIQSIKTKVEEVQKTDMLKISAFATFCCAQQFSHSSKNV